MGALRTGCVTLAAAATLALGPSTAMAQGVQLVPFGGETYASPYHVVGEPGNPDRVYVVEGAGRIHLVENGVTQSPAFLDIRADVCFSSPEPCGEESGMFSMALAPDYAASGRFYVFYTRDAPAVGEVYYLRIEEFRRSTTNPDLADISTRRVVLEIPHLTSAHHNGGQLQFGPDGLLYISTGDGGNTPDLARNLTTRLGKILRIDPTGSSSGEYSIPADNPFADGAGGNADEIYSYGLRNPYRFSFDRLTGDLVVGDVGGHRWEELDFMAAGTARGANFGWNCFEGAEPYELAPLNCTAPPSPHTPPALQYAHPPTGGASVSAGYVVRDGALPSLLGRFVYADTLTGLSNQIYSVRLVPGGSSGNAPTGLTATFVVSFGEDACGHIYAVRLTGQVLRIEPTTGPFPCQPQLVPESPPPLPPPPAAPPTGAPLADARGPGLSIDSRSGGRAGARGKVEILVQCDERCRIDGSGKIALPGKDIGLDQDSVTLAAGVSGALEFDLSRKEAGRLRKSLGDGQRAKAEIDLVAFDDFGNQSTAERQIKQRR